MSNDIHRIFEELVLNNKLGIKDKVVFEEESRKHTLIRAIELNANPIQGNFDYQHLKDIHKYIFQDIFTWAKDRFELKLFGFMYKGDSAFCAGEFIPNEAKRIFENLEKQNYLKDSKSLDS
ncbi:hypothetical protein CCZ01_09745, partial [Helicobacter monodelphidis]